MADSPGQDMEEPAPFPPNAPETCGHPLHSLSPVSKWLPVLLWAINASFPIMVIFFGSGTMSTA